MKKVVATQIVKHIDKNNMMKIFQSAYRPHHSTETVLVRVFNDFTVNLDHGEGTCLALLDLFIDHDKLLTYLSDYLCFGDNALKFMNTMRSD